MSCRKEKVIFLQMGNMKSNLSNNVLDLLLQKSYIPASNFSTCFATTIVNKRTLENTEWEILHSKLQPLAFYVALQNVTLNIYY